ALTHRLLDRTGALVRARERPLGGQEHVDERDAAAVGVAEADAGRRAAGVAAHDLLDRLARLGDLVARRARRPVGGRERLDVGVDAAQLGDRLAHRGLETL